MSIGLQLLHSVVQSGAQTAFRQCPAIWFSVEETPVYAYFVDHLNRHGRLPSLAALNEQGISLPRAPEPPLYYIDRLRKRAIFIQLEHLTPNFLEAIAARNMDAALSTLDLMRRNAHAVNPSADTTNIIEQGRLVLEQYEVAHRTHRLLGVTLGWDCLDAVTLGGLPGDVIVLVGRPSVGKTYGLLWMLRKAWLAGASVLVASMEMPADQITRRIVGLQSGLNPQVIRQGRLSTWGRDLMHETVSGFDDLPPFNIITGDFRKRVSDIDKAAQEFSPDIIAVDAGYLLTPDKNKSGGRNRREIITDVIEELKAVASNRGRPLLTSVQFNREVKRKVRTELDLSQIAETDAIGQIASIVIGMQYGEGDLTNTTRVFEMLKNREGPLVKWMTNFSFAPVDLSFISLIVQAIGAEAEDDADARVRTSFMRG